jgi:dihydrodiol dehydrogenase / D-xylose 1-dehydrogenase (NADP)
MYLCHLLMEKTAGIGRSGDLGQIQFVTGLSAANSPGLETIYNLGCYSVSLNHFIIETAFGPEAFQRR